MSHLCGLCLTLRDEHGHAARLVTNYDGLLVSVLAEAQAPKRTPHRRAAPCALRGFARADVVAATDEGARLAAAVSLVLAAGKTDDHIADHDGIYRRRLVASVAGRTADRWASAGTRTADALGFDATVLTEAVRRQADLESTDGLRLLDITEPTETAVAAAFAHTATLAGTPHNVESLAEAGRHFGRLAHLLDAVEDLPADRAVGAYNPLVATDTSLTEARRYCDDALLGLRMAVDDLDLEDARLARALLVKEVRRSVDAAFARRSGPYDPGRPDGHPLPPGGAPPTPPPSRPNIGLVCLAGGLVGCTCGLWRPPWSPKKGEDCGERCCCDDCGCDGCDCDCGC